MALELISNNDQATRVSSPTNAQQPKQVTEKQYFFVRSKILLQFKSRNEMKNYFKNFSFISKLNIFPDFPKCVSPFASWWENFAFKQLCSMLIRTLLLL